MGFKMLLYLGFTEADTLDLCQQDTPTVLWHVNTCLFLMCLQNGLSEVEKLARKGNDWYTWQVLAPVLEFILWGAGWPKLL
jgi:hypothetical protein